MKKITVLIAVGFLSACGGFSQISPIKQDEVESKLPTIASNDGQLCICRSNNWLQSARSYDITANKEFIGNLINDSYFCVNLSPKEYVIRWESGTTIPGFSTKTVIKKGQRNYLGLHVTANMSGSFSASDRKTGLSCISSTIK